MNRRTVLGWISFAVADLACSAFALACRKSREKKFDAAAFPKEKPVLIFGVDLKSRQALASRLHLLGFTVFTAYTDPNTKTRLTPDVMSRTESAWLKKYTLIYMTQIDGKTFANGAKI